MILQEKVVVGGDYAVHRHAITDTPEVVAGHALETASTVEKLVGAEALARQLHSLVARVGSVPPFGPAIRVHVIASGLLFGANNAYVGVRVSAKTFTVRHCLCPNCGNDHTEGEPFDDEFQPHYDEDTVTFTVHEASLLSRWDDYAVPGFGNFLERVGWEEVPA